MSLTTRSAAELASVPARVRASGAPARIGRGPEAVRAAASSAS